MAHVNKTGYPIVTPMFYVIMDDGLVYMRSIQKYRKKVHDLEVNRKVSVTIYNDSSNANKQKAILIIGKAEITHEQELMKEVHRKIIDKYWWDRKDEEIRQAAFKGRHTPNRASSKSCREK